MDPDQLASNEASWSASTLFRKGIAILKLNRQCACKVGYDMLDW